MLHIIVTEVVTRAPCYNHTRFNFVLFTALHVPCISTDLCKTVWLAFMAWCIILQLCPKANTLLFYIVFLLPVKRNIHRAALDLSLIHI